MPRSARYAAKHGYAHLLPDDAEDVSQLDLVKAETADDGYGNLATCVTARTHQHGHEGG